MGEVKQLKLHIRILYIAITALLAWTVVLSLLPPKSHYRDVTIDDLIVEKRTPTHGSGSAIVDVYIEMKHNTVAFTIRFNRFSSYYEKRVDEESFGDLKKGERVRLVSCDYNEFEIFEVFGKIDIHLD